MEKVFPILFAQANEVLRGSWLSESADDIARNHWPM